MVPKSKMKGIEKTADKQGFNNSFMTTQNIIWFHEVMKWLPDREKPLVFLPCAAARKTRGKNNDLRKFISQSTTHQFLSSITRNKSYERVILSEPLTVIPYALESHPLRPDYNLPVKDLSIQSEWLFIHQLALFLLNVKNQQPTRQRVFYTGARHHYFVLYFANKIAEKPFELIYNIASNGIKDYSKVAGELNTALQEFLKTGNLSWTNEVMCFRSYLKSRGRYTDKKFWARIEMWQNEDLSEVTVCDQEESITGFKQLYVV